MAEPRRQYPFVLRVLFFAVVFTVLATVFEPIVRKQGDVPYTFSWEQTQRYFLTGVAIAGVMLLYFRIRKRNLPGK